GNPTSVDYDGLGRPWRLVSHNSGTVTVEYNGFGDMTSATDNAGNRTRYTYDRIGRPVRKDDRSGTTIWHYDQGIGAVGRLSATSSPDCLRTAYDYAPAWGAELGAARIAGALTQSRLFVGSERFDVGYHYDAHGRVARIDYPSLLGARARITSRYGRRSIPTGSVSHRLNTESTRSLRALPVGRLGSQHRERIFARLLSGAGFAVRNGYDAVGNLVTIDGVFDDELDPRRLWTFVDDDDGHRIRVEQLGQAITTTHSYQPRSGRLQSLHSSAGGTVLQNLTYGYDAAGRVRSTIDAVEPASSRIYRHDPLDRLEKVFQAVDNDPQRIGALVRELSYDPTGNILTQTGIGA
ncbi:MAG: RHS repeat protein, partial [Proteobacteria bacterium]|nr:RHS repeat protein [Pseudomonadota bacterium]